MSEEYARVIEEREKLRNQLAIESDGNATLRRTLQATEQQLEQAQADLADLKRVLQATEQAMVEQTKEYEAEILKAQARIDELIPECDAAYAPYREKVQEARAETDKFANSLAAAEMAGDALEIMLHEAQAENARLKFVLNALYNHPIVKGNGAGIRDLSLQLGIPNPMELARAALKPAVDGMEVGE